MLRNCEALFNSPGRVKTQDIYIETEVGTAIFFLPADPQTFKLYL